MSLLAVQNEIIGRQTAQLNPVRIIQSKQKRILMSEIMSKVSLLCSDVKKIPNNWMPLFALVSYFAKFSRCGF